MAEKNTQTASFPEVSFFGGRKVEGGQKMRKRNATSMNQKMSMKRHKNEDTTFSSLNFIERETHNG